VKTAFDWFWLHSAGLEDGSPAGLIVVARQRRSAGSVVGAGQIQTKLKLGTTGVHLTERVKSFEPALDEAQQRIPAFLGTVDDAGLQI
jgi:hypothetical protein